MRSRPSDLTQNQPPRACQALITHLKCRYRFRKVGKGMAMLKDHFDTTHSEISEIEKCLQYCEASCITAVEAGLYYIDVTGRELDSQYLERLGASVEICSLGPDFLEAQDVEMYKQIIGICTDVCENCADTCRVLDDDDPFIQECAALCRQYAQRCRDLNGQLDDRVMALAELAQPNWMGVYA